MQIKLNRDHLRLWGYFAYIFALYYVIGLIAGFATGIRPRPDEMLFIASLPLFVVVPYVAFCLIAAFVKSWLVGTQGLLRWTRGRLIRRD